MKTQAGLEIDGFDIDGDVLSYDASIVSEMVEIVWAIICLFNPESNWNGNVEILVEVSMKNILWSKL